MRRLLLLVALVCGCRNDDGATTRTRSAGPAASSATLPVDAPPLAPKASSIRQAARLGTPAAAGALARLLVGAPEERAWAALGIAPHCRKRPADFEPSLTLSLASAGGLPFEATLPLAWALASCGTPTAGASLDSTLTSGVASKEALRAAAIVLGKFADTSGGLSERAQTRLLDLAEQEKDGVYLYPLTRLSSLAPAIAARALEVTGPLLESDAPGRRHVLLALGATGSLGVLPLRAVFDSAHFSDVDRATAAQALGRLGPSGQKELRSALEGVQLPSSAKESGWLAVRAMLRALVPTKSTSQRLLALTELPLAEDPAQRRRVIFVRCRTAELLAGDRSDDPRLAACDPDGASGSIEGRLALLHVLGRSKLVGEKRRAWRALADDPDPRVASEALRTGFEHRELDDETRSFDEKLDHPPEGVRLAILRGLAQRPELSHRSPKDETVRDELLRRLENLLRVDAAADVGLETRAAAIDVAGSIRALSTKPAVEKHCTGSEPSFYPAAERALALLGEPNRRCEGPERTETKFEVAARESLPDAEPKVTLEIESDVGVLALVFDVPGTGSTRATLIREFDSGRYNGIFVSAISEGYGVQFGDRDGDGVLDLEIPLPDERTPLLFEKGLFGLSGFQRGSALPHFFVALSDAFPLTMERVILGRVSGPFELLVPGDRLRSFRAVSK